MSSMFAVKGKKIILICLIAVLVLGFFATARYFRLESLNDAIRVGDKDEIAKQIDKLTAKQIDSAESSKLIYHPLNLACEKGDFDTVKKLVEKGVNVNAREHATQNTPLLSALYNRNSLDRCKIAFYLIENGADVNAVNKYGETALTRVICNSQNTREESIELFKYLYTHSDVDSMFPNEYMNADNALEMVSDIPELVDWLKSVSE